MQVAVANVPIGLKLKMIQNKEQVITNPTKVFLGQITGHDPIHPTWSNLPSVISLQKLIETPANEITSVSRVIYRELTSKSHVFFMNFQFPNFSIRFSVAKILENLHYCNTFTICTKMYYRHAKDALDLNILRL